MAAGNTAVGEVTFLVQGLIGLGHNELVLHIGGHVDHLIGDHTGLFVHLTVRCLNEAVLIQPAIASQIRDQADVGTFGSLNGAHSAVMGIVYISHLKPGAVTGQTAGAQCGQTTLMGQLRQGVVLVHKLRQRRGAEELTNGSHHRANVNQCLGGNGVLVVLCLQGHTLTNHALHTGKADTELVLQQLAYCADTTIAQVVNVVCGAYTASQVAEIRHGSKNIVCGNVLGHQVVLLNADLLFQCLFIIAALLQDLCQHSIADLFADTQRGAVKVHIFLDIDHAVGHNFYLVAVHIDKCKHNTCIFDLHGLDLVDLLTGVCQELTLGRDHRFCQDLAVQAVSHTQLFVILVATHSGQIVPVRVKEQAVQVSLCRLQSGRLAGTQALVHLQECLLLVLGGVLLNGGHQALILTEIVNDLMIETQTQRTQESGDKNLAVFINAHIEQVVGVGLILQPCAPVGDHGVGIQFLTGLVMVHVVIHAGGTHQLRHNAALCTVDYKSAGIRHQREVAHEDDVLLHLTGLFVLQAGTDLQRFGVSHIPCLTLGNGVLGVLVHGVVDKVQHQIACIIRDGTNVAEHLFQTFIQEPLVRFLLHFNEVGHLHHFIDLCKTLSCCGAELHVFHVQHKRGHSNLFFSEKSRNPAPIRCRGPKFFARPGRGAHILVRINFHFNRAYNIDEQARKVNNYFYINSTK